MSEEMNHELLKATAEEHTKEEAKREQEALMQSDPEVYTPRPVGQRVLAWVLTVIVIIGLVLYYWHIANG